MSASESESDSELDVSRYDVEDDLNVYESPVYKARETTAAPVSEPIQTQFEQNRTQVSVFFGLVYDKIERVFVYHISYLVSFVVAKIHAADAAVGNKEDVHVKTRISSAWIVVHVGRRKRAAKVNLMLQEL